MINLDAEVKIKIVPSSREALLSKCETSLW
jgi:hypothetical protein